MRTITALATVIALTLTAHAKPHRKPPHESSWMRACIHERTGPDGGVSRTEARKICKADEPDDELEAAKSALTLAKLNARVTKAGERARKALESCAQAVTDRCVESADPVTGTDCDVDVGLHAEFALVCLGQVPVKPTATH